MEYGELVRKNYKPEIKEESDEDEKQNLANVKSMSVFEMRKQGNEYMKEINMKAR